MIPIMALWAIPLVRKVAIYGLITVAVLTAFWFYRRSLINQGIQVGISRGTEIERKAREKEWAVREKQLDDKEAALIERESAGMLAEEENRKDRAKIEEERAAVNAALKNVYAETKKALASELLVINAATGSDIDDILRDLSARIDEWQAARKTPEP